MRKPDSFGAKQPAGPDAGADALLHRLPWGVVVLDAQGTVRRLNEQAAAWWGVQPADVLAKPPAELPAGNLPAGLLQALRRVAEGPGTPPGEFFLPQPRQWLAMTSTRQGDGWVVYWQDVTTQKQQESQHRAQQAAHNALLQRTEAAARTGSYELELATGRLLFSDGMYRLFGEEPGAFEPSMALIDARSHADDAAAVQQVLARAVENRQPYCYQRRIYRPDGQLRTLECHGQVECDTLGQPVQLLGLVQDVTAREQTAQELLQAKDELARRATDNYLALHNSMDEGFCIVEVLFDAAHRPTDYRFLDVNPTFEKQSGLRGALGKTMRELAPAHEQHWFDTYGRVARTGEPQRFEAHSETLGRWFDVNAFPIGERPGNRPVAVLFTDITERRRTAEALRQSEEQFRQLVTATSDAVYRMNADWTQIQQLVGKDFLADTRATTHAWVEEYLLAEDLPQVRAAIAAAIRDKAPFEMQHRVRRADGTVGWTCSRAIPTLDAQGAITGWLGTARDVSARKQAEEALQVSEAKYRTLFETMDQGFGIGEVLPAGPGRAADFRWLEVNPQVECLTGMPQAALLSGETMRTVMPQLDDILYEQYEGVALTGESMRFEQYAQVLGRWFDVYVYALDGPASRRIALLFTNITARKQAEEALRHAEERHREELEQQVTERTQQLRESQARLQSVFDSTTNAVVLLRAVRDAAGGILDFEYVLVNPVTQAYHGSQNPTGQRYRDLLPGTQRQAAFGQLVTVVKTGRRADFEVYHDHEGARHWFRLIGVKLNDGVLYSAEDITARKLLEQAQAQSLALLRQSEAVAGMGSWEYDLRTREFTWSDGLYHLLARPVGSPTGLQVLLDAVQDDDRPVAADLVRTLTTGAGAFDTTLRLRLGDAVKTVRFKAVPLPDTGPPERVLGVCLDVTDVQRLEDENLALKLDRHKELLLAILQAQETERQRLGEVLHNGLGQMLYATKLHLDQLDTPALHAQPVLSGLYRQTGRLLADAMRQTRTLAHELVPTSLLNFGLPAAVRDVCRNLSTPQLRITCHVWGEETALPQPVQVTLFRLAQELAHNIVRHAGATQATLELETLPNGVSLRAEDNGRGFDPHTVVDGLGLRTVRQAVALLGGTVAVDSSPEFGTHLRLHIPLP